MIYKIRKMLDHYLPEALTIAFCLTILTLLFGCIIQQESPFQMIFYWYEGFWGFTIFTLQMAMMLILGSSIATSEPIKNVFARLTLKIKTPRKALSFIMIVTAVFTYINWGIGTLVGPILAKFLKQEMPNLNLAHLIAASYSAYLVILPMSISVTVPLLVNTPGHFLEDKIGIVPFSETIFSPSVMSTGIFSFIALFIFYHIVMPLQHDEKKVALVKVEKGLVKVDDEKKNTFAHSLDNSKLLSYVLCIFALSAIVIVIYKRGWTIDFNLINFFLLFLGISLYGSPQKYFYSFSENIRNVSGIILQFPLYSGIMGMISGSGLIVTITEWIMNSSTIATFPFLVFVLSGLINFFIPSNGGQWMIAGPLLISAGQGLGIPTGTIINAFTFGTFSSNFLQPFWALPVLALSGLTVKDIWGYCLVSFVLFFLIAAVGMSL